MIEYKTDEEIELLRESNMLVSKTLAEISTLMKPGVSTISIDKRAEEFIRDNGGVPGFLNYNGYPNTLCISVNDQIVHGIPSDYKLKNSDIVSVDCGVIMNGFYGDSAYTFKIGDVDEKVQKLMDVTRQALFLGIENARPGKRIGDISFSIQDHAEKNGFSVVRDLVGHGVGRNLHEEPQVPNFGRRGKGVKIKPGLVIAIEPMINMGGKEAKQEKDGWTIKTADGSKSAHFEHTIAVKKEKTELLSDFEIIDKAIKCNLEI